MRIISGTSKGRKLATPKGLTVRPTSDRVKESIFNILTGQIEGAEVLDLFAGTGNLGIEALSRGAKEVTFIEKTRRAVRLIQRNLEQFGMSEQSEVLFMDASRAIGILKQRRRIFDLIFMDPPYGQGLIERTLTKLTSHPIYHGDSVLVIEHHRRELPSSAIEAWNLIRQRQMGQTIISILTPRGGEAFTKDEMKP